MFRSMNELIECVTLELDHNKYHPSEVWTCAIGKALKEYKNPFELVAELLRLGDAQTLLATLLFRERNSKLMVLAHQIKTATTPKTMMRYVESPADTLRHSMDIEAAKEDDTLWLLAYDVIKFECHRRGYRVTDHERPRAVAA